MSHLSSNAKDQRRASGASTSAASAGLASAKEARVSRAAAERRGTSRLGQPDGVLTHRQRQRGDSARGGVPRSVTTRNKTSKEFGHPAP